MQIIGEKINGAIARVGQAIAERDGRYIAELVSIQEAGGADYLDLCAGTASEDELEALLWLVEVVQEVASVPLCIDSPDADIFAKVLPQVERPGIINSFSAEGDKCAKVLALLGAYPEWQAIGLCSGSEGVAVDVESKLRVAGALIDEAAARGIGRERLLIDPLVLALTVENDAALDFCAAIRGIKDAYPGVRIAAALSNVSFGMPVRSLVNRNLLAFALEAGLDCGIVDPTDRELVGTLYAVEALLGRDRHSRRYNTAYRAGRIGPVPNNA